MNNFADCFNIPARNVNDWEKIGCIPKIRTGLCARKNLFARAAQITVYICGDTASMKKRMAYPLGFKQGIRDGVEEVRVSLLDYGDHTYDYNIPSEINTIRIARQLGMNQKEFASRFRIPLETLQAWETGRQTPDDAMKAYIMEIDRHPNAVLSTLG